MIWKRFQVLTKTIDFSGTPILGGDRRETLRALYERKKSKVQTLDIRKVRTRKSLNFQSDHLILLQNKSTRQSIASDMDNQRVFTPTAGSIVGSVNDAYESESEIYGRPPSYRSVSNKYGMTEQNVTYRP